MTDEQILYTAKMMNKVNVCHFVTATPLDSPKTVHARLEKSFKRKLVDKTVSSPISLPTGQLIDCYPPITRIHFVFYMKCRIVGDRPRSLEFRADF